MLAETRFCRGIAKSPVAFVDEQLVRSRLVHLGMAVVVVAEAGTDGFVIEIPFQIVDDDEIEQSVVVDVNPGGGDGPQGAILRVGFVETGPGGDVGKRSVAVVVIQRVAIDACYENVLIPVIVVVSDRDAGVIACPFEASLFRDVGEVSFAIVLEEAVVVLGRIFFQRLEVSAVGEKDIELAVIVVIEDSDTSGHRFRSVMLGAFVAVEFEVYGLKDEMDGAVRNGCFGSVPRLSLGARHRESARNYKKKCSQETANDHMGPTSSLNHKGHEGHEGGDGISFVRLRVLRG